MAVDVLLGLQWGDEGKGKIVDVLTRKYDIIARFQGGPNAGHTLEFENIKHVLHTIPSGIFHKGIKNLVGNGVVIDPIIFKKEIDALLSGQLSQEDEDDVLKELDDLLATEENLEDLPEVPS
ncbi:MAG: adenylosuccinate synthetase, partial [Owenweeksia sp.]